MSKQSLIMLHCAKIPCSCEWQQHVIPPSDSVIRRAALRFAQLQASTAVLDIAVARIPSSFRWNTNHLLTASVSSVQSHLFESVSAQFASTSEAVGPVSACGPQPPWSAASAETNGRDGGAADGLQAGGAGGSGTSSGRRGRLCAGSERAYRAVAGRQRHGADVSLMILEASLPQENSLMSCEHGGALCPMHARHLLSCSYRRAGDGHCGSGHQEAEGVVVPCH